MPRPKHRIRLTSGDGKTAHLLVDDTDISANVSALHLDVTAGDCPRLTLNVIAYPATVEATDAYVGLAQETHDLLVRLGWTPPPSEEEDADVLD